MRAARVGGKAHDMTTLGVATYAMEIEARHGMIASSRHRINR